jgi:hypothetical protein
MLCTEALAGVVICEDPDGADGSFMLAEFQLSSHISEY